MTPICIRLFCKRGAVVSKHFDAKQSLETAEKVHDSEIKMNGGWGYFLIKRGKDFSTASSMECHPVIELYLYKEGE
jgi:hypothetical protein